MVPPLARVADRVTALIAGHAPEAVRLRRTRWGCFGVAAHEIPHLVRGSGLSRQLLLALLRSAGADIGWDGDTVWFAGVQREYHALIAGEFTASSLPDDAVPAVLVERMPSPPSSARRWNPATRRNPSRRMCGTVYTAGSSPPGAKA